MTSVNIIGAGLSGLSAAILLAKNGITSNLFSLMPSERAQSVLAEGGINGALNTMGEEDCPDNHYNDTLRAGCYIADEEAVRGLADNAPLILRELQGLGVPFNRNDKDMELRNFGGQKKKRTAYAKSSTGKIIMNALIDEARKYEVKGLINRFPHHDFVGALINSEGKCAGVRIKDTYTDEEKDYYGNVILAFGGMNGMFKNSTTGTTLNSGNALATVFSEGVRLGNLEMIQFHPTTIGICNKRCLISEAARGEGGRLFIYRDDKKYYFMEDKFPEYGNLSPRDVVSREMFKCGCQVYLDMSELSSDIWKNKLPDLRKEIIHYLNIDPAKTPVPVEPGIHYFMGGIDVDKNHRTNIDGLFAVGECCMQYHGANRLGGNSMLGAIYGGQTAANYIINNPAEYETKGVKDLKFSKATPKVSEEISNILKASLPIIRNEENMAKGLEALEKLITPEISDMDKRRVLLAKAMINSALFRKESRGAHYRADYPDKDEKLADLTVADLRGEETIIELKHSSTN